MVNISRGTSKDKLRSHSQKAYDNRREMKTTNGTLVVLGLLFIGTEDFDRRKTLNAVWCTNGLVFGHVDRTDIDDALQDAITALTQSFNDKVQKL